MKNNILVFLSVLVVFLGISYVRGVQIIKEQRSTIEKYEINQKTLAENHEALVENYRALADSRRYYGLGKYRFEITGLCDNEELVRVDLWKDNEVIDSIHFLTEPSNKKRYVKIELNQLLNNIR